MPGISDDPWESRVLWAGALGCCANVHAASAVKQSQAAQTSGKRNRKMISISCLFYLQSSLQI